MKTYILSLLTLLISLPATAHHSPFEESTPWLWYLGIASLCAAAFYVYRVKRKPRKTKPFSMVEDNQ
jgi:uncharacterized membrane protein